VAWQWLTTAHFRKKLPKDAEKGAWNPLYTTPQPKQEQSEPVALVTKVKIGGVLEGMLRKSVDAESIIGAKLYTTPQQRTWVGLTEEEKIKLWNRAKASSISRHTSIYGFDSRSRCQTQG
jgi:hypothetical protein